MTLRGLLIAGALGIGLGFFSWRGDWLPVESPLVVLVALANAVGPWLAVAFVAGAVQGRAVAGAIGGLAALAIAVATYYLGASLASDAPMAHPVASAVVWLAAAIIAGPVLGAAGGAWAEGREPLIAVSLLSGALLAEAAYRFIEVEGWTGIDLGRTALQVAAVDLGCALLLPFLLLAPPERTRAFALMLAVGAVTLVILAGAMAAIRAVLIGA